MHFSILNFLWHFLATFLVVQFGFLTFNWILHLFRRDFRHWKMSLEFGKFQHFVDFFRGCWGHGFGGCSWNMLAMLIGKRQSVNLKLLGFNTFCLFAKHFRRISLRHSEFEQRLCSFRYVDSQFPFPFLCVWRRFFRFSAFFHTFLQNSSRLVLELVWCKNLSSSEPKNNYLSVLKASKRAKS